MAQPYDLSGIANVQTTIAQMLRDQKSGAVKFAGGFETWVPNPTGYFYAKLSSGGGLTPTTTNAVRISIKDVRVTLDLIAGGTGSVAANAIQGVTPPSLLLETGRAPTGPTVAYGPIVNSPTTIANTKYDLSGIAALQTSVNQMLADQQNNVTTFIGNAAFNAIFATNGSTQKANINSVIALFSAMTAQYDLLDQ